MRYFIDTEFSERGYDRIDLISIGIAAEDGRTYYAEAIDGWSPDRCNDWVKANVLPLLKGGDAQRTRLGIRADIVSFVTDQTKPEFWGYYADYDWVLFCQLFGTMMDLPARFPKYCRDLKQLAGDRRLPKQQGGEHNALADAIWARDSYKLLTSAENRP